jgi:hypothetical protein
MRKMLISAIALASYLLVSGIALAEDPTLLYYILDGSGSMWGRVDGKMKIQIAKDIMSKLIQDTPADIYVGLMVYGHRRVGDCSDIEEIINIGSLDKTAAISTINNITPRGKTPLTDSIAAAIDRLKDKKYAATIVLVSDGIETCDKDPCAITKKLKDSGINFVMHVVGFGTQSGDAQQLSCIAQAGGGKYFSAANAAELLNALNKIKASVVEKKEVEAVAPETAAELIPAASPQPSQVVQKISKTSASVRIKAKGAGKIALKYDSWLAGPSYWKLVSLEDGKEKAKFKGMDEQIAEPGQYQIIWRQMEHGGSDVNLAEVVDVKPGETTEVALTTAVRIIAPTWVKEPYYWGLIDLTTNDELARFCCIGTELVPPGDYGLIWRQTEHGAKAVTLSRVSVVPGQVNEVQLTTALNLVPAEWVPNEVYYWALKAADGAQVIKFSGGFEPQLAPAGVYQLIYRQTEHGSTDSILGEATIAEGKMNEFPVNTGIKLVPKPGAAPPYLVEFIGLETQNKVELRESFGPMPLRPGKYKVTYQQREHGSSKVALIDSVDVPSGSLVEIEL